MLAIMSGEVILLKAIDEYEDNMDGIWLYAHTTSLPIEIKLKPNMFIELYSGNYNTSDGLVNSYDDIFKHYRKHDMLDIVWIKFNDPNIGYQQKRKYASYYNQYITKDWILIIRIAKLIQKIWTSKKITIRKQFPIQLACARTIHRSQWLTMETLAFDPTTIRQHGITYRTISCTKTMENLFHVKPLLPIHFRVKPKINTEMEHLQSNAQWKLDNQATCQQSTMHMIWCTLNTRSLHTHINDI